MKPNLPPDIKIIIVPIASLLALLVLGYLLLSLGLTKILDQQKQIGDMEKEVTVLDQKSTILSNITPTIAQNANQFSFALPAEDPAPMVFSQFKVLASTTGVAVGSLSSHPVTKADTLPETNIIVEVTGPLPGVFSFLTGLKDIAPLVVVDSVTLSQDKDSNGMIADITVNSFWSAYPATIPASSDPITDLSSSEKDMITEIATYKTPEFTELTPTEPSSSRSNPFGD